MLTLLSYYYSGLSDGELEECFVRLNCVSNKEQEYASWINEIPSSRNVNASIRDFSSINLTDFKQKNEYLFPALRRNRLVVDFWLSQTVFPRESRAFEKKLVCTAWDLCSESFKNPVTGFSGTNDSTVLLPLPISQQDLPKLQNTNENLRKTILLPENNNFTILPRGTGAMDILNSLVKKNISILLDSGALMLELSNEKVAEEWLKLLQRCKTTNYEAAVYFDDNHNLMVKDRNHLDESSPYELSPYREKMNVCVVYLDDAHTRGTDLKIPPPSSACVTLCAGITRDKMVQACMRMRLLGKGHTISFYASDEAANGIRANAIANIEAQDVLNWVTENSLKKSKSTPGKGRRKQVSSNQMVTWFGYPVGQCSPEAPIILQMPATFEALPRDLIAEQIVKTLTENLVDVLFDTGGLLSCLSNAEVAEKWLLESPALWDAAVYFDGNNELVLKHRDPLKENILFNLSSYVKSPLRCLFYVDVAHTRVGDFMTPPPAEAVEIFAEVANMDSAESPTFRTFPEILTAIAPEINACVTLCANLTHDKIIPCRLIEKVQFLLFFASDEATREIESSISNQLGSRHVMDWVCKNSRKFEQDGLVYWSGSGLNYAHKRTVEHVFGRITAKSDSDYVNLGERCCDPDFLTLMSMYGEHRKNILYTDVLKNHIKKKWAQIQRPLESYEACIARLLFDSIQKHILQRCIGNIQDKRVLGQLLDEEHEKENEEEAEEEKEIFRPSSRDPAIHVLSPHVESFMKSGNAGAGLRTGDIQKLHLSLKNTSFFVAQDWCGVSLFVTRDFANVIKSNTTDDKEDEFLRTPNWIASYKEDEITTKLVILSPFEVDRLIPSIRLGKTIVNIRMFAPRMTPRQSSLINSRNLAFLPLSRPGAPSASGSVPLTLLAPLYLFSGTLYFRNEAEHDAYCYFTGILPREWTPEVKAAFDAGQIDNRGFIPKEYRSAISTPHNDVCQFEEHPELLIRGIVKARHIIFPSLSHVSQVVLDCRRVANYDH